MRTFTKDEFIQFAESAEWVVKEDSDCSGDYEKPDGYSDDGERLVKPMGYGYIWKTATCGDIEVTHQKQVEWEGTTSERYTDDYETSPIENGDEWQTAGFEIIEDGDVFSRRELHEAMEEIFFTGNGSLPELNSFEIENLIPPVVTQEVDMNVENAKEFDLYDLDNDNAPNIEFRGELIGSASSRDVYRSDTRWTVYKIYRTAGGTLIGQIIGHSQWQGEDTRYKARVCDSEADLIKFMGYSDASKEAYEEAGIDSSVKVE